MEKFHLDGLERGIHVANNTSIGCVRIESAASEQWPGASLANTEGHWGELEPF